MFAFLIYSNATLITDTALSTEGVKYRYNKATYDEYKQQSETIASILFNQFIYSLFCGDYIIELTPISEYSEENIKNTFSELFLHAQNSLNELKKNEAAKCLDNIMLDNEVFNECYLTFQKYLKSHHYVIFTKESYNTVIATHFSNSLQQTFDANMQNEFFNKWVVPVYKIIATSVDKDVKKEKELQSDSFNSGKNVSGPNETKIDSTTKSESIDVLDRVCYIVIDIFDFDEILKDMEKLGKEHENNVIFRLNLSSVFLKSISCFLNPFKYEKVIFEREEATNHIYKISNDYLRKIGNFLLKLKIDLESAEKHASIRTKIGQNLKIQPVDYDETDTMFCIIEATPGDQTEFIKKTKEMLTDTLAEIAKLENIFVQFLIHNDFSEYGNLEYEYGIIIRPKKARYGDMNANK